MIDSLNMLKAIAYKEGWRYSEEYGNPSFEGRWQGSCEVDWLLDDLDRSEIYPQPDEWDGEKEAPDEKLIHRRKELLDCYFREYSDAEPKRVVELIAEAML